MDTTVAQPAPAGAHEPLTERGYKFLRSDLSSAYGSEGPWVVGETRTHDGPIVLCESGYHWSPTWHAAFSYAQGDCRAAVVEASAAIESEDTARQAKRVSRSMRVVTTARAETTRGTLVTWAADCAERALHRERERGREPHSDSWAAIAAVRRYLRGECDPDAVRLARKAALRAAADAAAYAAADAAAYAAAAAAYAAAAAAAAAAAYAADAAAYAADAAAYAADAAAERDWQAARLAELLDAAVGVRL